MEQTRSKQDHEGVATSPSTKQASRPRTSNSLKPSKAQPRAQGASPGHPISSISGIPRLSHLHPEESLTNLAPGGSLYLRSLDYRSQKIGYPELSKYFKKMNYRLETLFSELDRADARQMADVSDEPVLDNREASKQKRG